MQNIKRFITPISLSIIIVAILSSILGCKYIKLIEDQNTPSNNTLYITAKAEKTVSLDTMWATFDVDGVNLQGTNATIDNSNLFESRKKEISDKIKAAGIDGVDFTVEISDYPYYDPNATSSPYDYDCYSCYGEDEATSSYYETPASDEKRVFSIILGVPVEKISKDKIEALVNELSGTNVSIYKSLSREAYDKLSEDLEVDVIKDANHKAKVRAKVLGLDAVLQDNSFTSDINTLSYTEVDENTTKYYISKEFNYKLER